MTDYKFFEEQNKKKAGRMLAGRTYSEMPLKESFSASPSL